MISGRASVRGPEARAAYVFGRSCDLAAPEPDSWPGDEIAATAGLVDATGRSYEWTWNLPAEQYLSLLNTTSQYAIAAEPLRTTLFAALRQVLGHVVSLLGRTQLNLMRKAP